ncbi:unnamed protein product [Closterium sp. NIES-54]
MLNHSAPPPVPFTSPAAPPAASAAVAPALSVAAPSAAAPPAASALDPASFSRRFPRPFLLRLSSPFLLALPSASVLAPLSATILPLPLPPSPIRAKITPRFAAITFAAITSASRNATWPGVLIQRSSHSHSLLWLCFRDHGSRRGTGGSTHFPRALKQRQRRHSCARCAGERTREPGISGGGRGGKGVAEGTGAGR